VNEWDPADGWVLMSLPDPRPLRALISQMDHHMHLIPNRDELEGGLGRLEAAGLVAIDADEIRRTAEGEALVATAGRGAANWYVATDRVRAALQKLECPQSCGYRLTHAEYEAALS
jgi:hypothetical protein